MGRVTQTLRVSGLDALITLEDDFDPGHQVSEVTNAGSLVTLWSTKTRYDDAGRVYEAESETGLVTRYAYDAAGRQGTVTVDPDNTFGLLATTTYTYDAAGRQTTVTDPMGRVTTFTYDALGRVTATTRGGDTPTDDTDDLITRTEYDTLGRRVAEIDALGRRTGYAYDDVGRLVAVTLPELLDDGPDPADGLTATGSTAGVAIYQYANDPYGNQTSITDPRNNLTTFTYDERGRQTSRTLPLGQASELGTGFVESMHYDDTAITSVQAGATPASSTAGGQLAYAVDFEGNVTAYRYDNTAIGRGLVSKTYFDGADIAS